RAGFRPATTSTDQGRSGGRFSTRNSVTASGERASLVAQAEGGSHGGGGAAADGDALAVFQDDAAALRRVPRVDGVAADHRAAVHAQEAVRREARLERVQALAEQELGALPTKRDVLLIGDE